MLFNHHIPSFQRKRYLTYLLLMIIYVVSKYFHTANNDTINILVSRNATINIPVAFCAIRKELLQFFLEKGSVFLM